MMPQRGHQGEDSGNDDRNRGDPGRGSTDERLAPASYRAEPPGAATRLVELAGQRAARSEDQGLDRRLGQLELLGDLAVRQPLPLAQQDRALLVGRQPRERVGEPRQLVVCGDGRGSKARETLRIMNRLNPAPPPGRAPALAAYVLGDLEEPG